MASADLVIFDCDGVLVDSELIGCRIEVDCLQDAGFPITLSELLTDFVGKSTAAGNVMLEARFGRPVPAAVEEEMRSRITAAFRSELQPVPGMREMLESLGKPACVASSSEPGRIRLSLELTGLLSFFEPNLFSSTMVNHGKPAPDLFLHAASQMGVAPARCVVVEDSVAGVQAALAAGMSVVGLSAASHCDAAHGQRLRKAGAPQVVTSTAALGELLRAT